MPTAATSSCVALPRVRAMPRPLSARRGALSSAGRAVAVDEALVEDARDDALGGEDWSAVAVAFSAAAVTGFVVVRWLMGYIKRHRFTGFALYRIVLGMLLLAFMPAGS